MRSSTLKTCRRLAILGVFAGPTFWLLKRLLSALHVLRDPAPGATPRTVADYMLDVTWWDGAVAIFLCLTVCSAILLYVIVCPPPRDIDQHET